MTTENRIEIRNSLGQLLYSATGSWRDVPFETTPFEDAQLPGLQLSGACLYGAKLRGANLLGADLYWCMAVCCDFSNANLGHADLRGANCKWANFNGADIRDADFGRNLLDAPSDLCGADLRNCKWEGARFFSALYDSSTQFPEGFSPQAEEMVYVDPS